MEENRISSLISSSLEGIRDLVDANTIIGTPIEAGSSVIIPVSKGSVGYVGGGNDYAGKHCKDGQNNFGGGGGTGVTVTPVGFLVIGESGRVEMVNVNNPTGGNDIGSSIENIISKTPDLIEKIKGIFKKKAKKEEENAAEGEDFKEETQEEKKD